MVRSAAVALAFAGAITVVAPAGAQDRQYVERARDWDVYNTTLEGSKACFIVTKPRTYDPEPPERHGDVFFYMTRRPSASVTAEPLLQVGYSFLEGSSVTATIGTSSFTFMTQGNRAFLDNPAEGPNLLSAMRAGSEMRVSGTSARRNAVNYSFSLSGVTAGTNRTAQECPA